MEWMINFMTWQGWKTKPESEIRREMKEVIKYVFNPELK